MMSSISLPLNQQIYTAIYYFLIRAPPTWSELEKEEAIPQASTKKAEERPKAVDMLPNLQEVLTDFELEANKFAKVSPYGPADAMANYVIENPQKFKKKKLANGRQGTPADTLEATLVTLTNYDLAERFKSTISGNVLAAFLKDFNAFFTAQNQFCPLDDTLEYDKDVTNQLLHQNFPSCRSQLIMHLVEEFSGRYSSAAAVCFFVESGYANLIQKYFEHIETQTWESITLLMPSARKRRKNWMDTPCNGSVAMSCQIWANFLARCRRDYQEIFDEENDRLVKNADQFERKVPEFTCEVCFETFSKKSAITCTLQVGLVDEEAQPGSSKALDNPACESHSFCVDCVRGAAEAATTEMPLAEGGVGLKCMAHKCPNPILFSECRTIIPPAIRKVLNDRITEENLGLAKLANLERCKRCNFAIQMEVPKEVSKVFSCLKCHYEYCRLCEADWDDIHFGKPCKEVEKIVGDTHKIANQMSEAIIRKCGKCSLPFVKLDGCNKMACRCGQTQCYICRATNIKYDHFCQHFRQPRQKGCTSCNKTCLLWQNAETGNKKELARIREEAVQNGMEAPI
uniref:RING-type domain-containing protein n=1 Tax=Ditylenchus dipsaci TaxID=166011 RepID=A0A915EGT7_9BILA